MGYRYRVVPYRLWRFVQPRKGQGEAKTKLALQHVTIILSVYIIHPGVNVDTSTNPPTSWHLFMKFPHSIIFHPRTTWYLTLDCTIEISILYHSNIHGLLSGFKPLPTALDSSWFIHFWLLFWGATLCCTFVARYTTGVTHYRPCHSQHGDRDSMA